MNVCLNVKLICNVLVVAFIVMVIPMSPDGSEEAGRGTPCAVNL